jgi:DEAD/DEAH box helicase domain-containing protein
MIDLLRRMPGFNGQIAHVRKLPARAPQFADPAEPVHPQLADILATHGITRLYAHQAAALDAVRTGAHIGVVTATASGKTLCYQIPALEAILAQPQTTALFLFPTKALAGDQLRALRRLAEPLDVRVDTLDGDTPRAQRDQIRARTQVVLSNPDLLHRTLLPDHRRWQSLIARLRYVVLDEAHIYRGVFGTHAALVLRRLRRLCALYGSTPQFICCSATSANPAQHLEALIGAPVTLIDQDGAPQGPKQFVLWNPPLLDRRPGWQSEAQISGRRSTNVEASGVLGALVQSNIKTLCFTRTRRGAELVLRYTRDTFERTASTGSTPPVAAYRAGYTPEDRRRLEQAFLTDELRALVSTNALELGVDIGGVDAVVIAGFPGTIASTWQQAGRAGRAGAMSMAVLVAQDDPMDQFYMRHPEEFFARSHEHARVALDNPYILRDQLLCAAAEAPLRESDAAWFGATFARLRDWMLAHGDLMDIGNGQAASINARPAAGVNIRSADGAPVELRDSESGRVIEQLAATRAAFEAYPGAIYLHQGDSYQVSELNETFALARRVYVNYYTQPREETQVEIERIQQRRRVGPAEVQLGVVRVTRQVIGYRRKEHYSEAVLSEHDLSLPPQTFRTVAVWWTVHESICRLTEQSCGDILDALHALEHACIGLLPLFAQCDRADIGGLSTNFHPQTGMATIFVYDGVPGGVGISQVGYEQAEDWWRQTHTLLLDCPCSEGCPACVQSPKCGNGNQHLSKPGAAALAALLLESVQSSATIS